MTLRSEILITVATQILALQSRGILRVAVDGVDAAGKTFFANELAAVLQASGRQIIRASVDGFHKPRSVRYRQGRNSPEGFYQDSYDYSKLAQYLLDPLGDGGSRRFRPAIFDHKSDSPVVVPEEVAEPNAILVFDGIFLHRKELRWRWDISIFLEVDFPVSISRLAERDEGSPEVDAESNRRYVDGQKIYLASCNPRSLATIAINNNDLEKPIILAL